MAHSSPSPIKLQVPTLDFQTQRYKMSECAVSFNETGKDPQITHFCVQQIFFQH